MLSYNPQVPILLVLNSHTKARADLFRLISIIQPQKLYIYWDGPGHEWIRDQIPAACIVKIRSNPEPKGYDRSLLDANKWFFRNETIGIVLNGYVNWQCLPAPDFFGFCSELLQKYESDERIGHICCGRTLRNTSDEDASYTYTRLPDLSFYATWKRTWEKFDEQVKTFRIFKKHMLFERFPTYRDFSAVWNMASSGKALSWTAQYEYVQLINNRLSVMPTLSLVESPETAYRDTLRKIIHPGFVVEDVEPAIESRELQSGMPSQRTFDATGYLFLKNQLLRMTKIAGSNLKIPKIIHHVCDYPNGIPENLRILAATWKKHHPDWEQRFWDKEQMGRFVHETFPDFEPYYLAYPHNAQRWDAIRYLILYHMGGLYVDLDYECLEPFDSILCGKTCCIALEPDLHARYNNKPRILSNALMVAKPGCGFMRKIIDELKAQDGSSFADLEKYKVILNTTGPQMVTRVYESLKNKKAVTLLPSDAFMPLTPKEISLAIQGRSTEFINYKLENAFAVHYFFNSW